MQSAVLKYMLLFKDVLYIKTRRNMYSFNTYKE